MKSFNEYKEYYEKTGKLLNDPYIRVRKLNERQLRTRYEKYQKKEEKRLKKSFIPDSKWLIIREEIFIRDNYRCRLWKVLTMEEKKEVLEDASLFALNDIDPAHVFGKGSCPKMKYVPENIVTLYRTFHSRLDAYLNPLNGTPISNSEREEWWKRILGEEEYKKLLALKEKLG